MSDATLAIVFLFIAIVCFIIQYKKDNYTSIWSVVFCIAVFAGLVFSYS